MEKVNYQNNDKVNNSKKIMTGAAKVTACVALSGLLVGSVGLRLASLECAANHSVDTICPIAKLDTLLFGPEAGMKHQAEDINKYNRIYEDHEEYTQGVTYMPAGSYVLPEGYEVRTDEDGQVYGYKENHQNLTPVCLENGTIYYTIVNEHEDMIMMQDATWTYEDGEYLKSTEEAQVLRKTK